MSDDFDQRRSERQTPLDSRAWLAWWERQRVVWSHVRLVDLSRSGAAVTLQREPSRDAPVMLSLQGTTAPDGLDATIVGLTRRPDGTYRARLEFLEPCPDEFLEAACELESVRDRLVTTPNDLDSKS